MIILNLEIYYSEDTPASEQSLSSQLYHAQKLPSLRFQRCS